MVKNEPIDLNFDLTRCLIVFLFTSDSASVQYLSSVIQNHQIRFTINFHQFESESRKERFGLCIIKH